MFPTIYGRNLIAELSNVIHRPYLVVTMDDLVEKFGHHFADDRDATLHTVRTLELNELRAAMTQLPQINAVIGLGGGQAIDVAKFVSWSHRLPLFQVPTSMSVDAVFGHRAAVREAGKVRYLGWAVPEAIYIDIDVIQGAPALLNRSGLGDILCYHTAHFDWQLAHKRGKTEPQWPYDQRLVDEAQTVLQRVLAQLDEIHTVTETGIRTLMEALRWGGAAYHNAGWNPRHIEGVEHFFFYTLEYQTGKQFIHGLPVCLGIYLGTALQDNEPERMLAAIQRAGIDIRPDAMGITWDDVATALRGMADYVAAAGLWYTVASEQPVRETFVENAKKRLEEAYQGW